MYALLGLLVSAVVVSAADHIKLEVWPQNGSEKPLISFKPSEPESYLPWIQRLDDFLADYRKTGSGSENRVACNYRSQPLGEGQVCDVPHDDFYPCVPSNEYSYQDGAPCIFLKLNQTWNWTPKPFKTMKELPKNMPELLKRHIKMLTGRPEANTAWVSCEGEGPADKRNMGPVQYIPRHGFPGYYFPFINQQGYLSPLVAVMFERPRAGVVINVVCKVWAKNIACEGCEQTAASARFQLLISS